MKLFSTRYASLGKRLLTEINSTPLYGDKTIRSEVIASAVLIRPPLCAPPMNDIEKDYNEMNIQMEFRDSLKSDFELEMEKDEILLMKKKMLEEEGRDLSELNEEIGITAVMKEEEWLEKSNKIKKKLLKVDNNEIKDNYKNLCRSPNTNLILSVKQKFGDGHVSPWIFPQTNNIQHCLRSSLETTIDEMFNGSIKIKMLGGAPFSYYKYKYPKMLRDSRGIDYGEFFFFGAILNDPSVDISINNKLIDDYQWLTSEEIDKCVSNSKKYLKKAKLCLHQ
ncbi:39S ribosomal protein L46, mitochondrial [Strongyloides ratti]|uniref:39S ribosomal protein L46, mitochondrial n=1 Tax=Strongyloides ratti TaxID=34506 RepID=A0A090LAQ7_STRRB|nr:39S ribosomal protein L46, mitochondrial [Strongyloides ratti]CEF66837.1 39S ribosomal protein L46, mitochondrial [Strongyloides ratti]